MTFRRNHSFLYILPLLIAGAFLFPGTLTGKARKSGKKEAWSAGADRRKADYIYMEALRQNALDNDAEFFDLLSRSQQLDSTETAPGQTYGYYLYAIARGDSALQAKGHALMRRHFYADPSDYYGAIFYGLVCQRIGDMEEGLKVWQTLDSLNPERPEIALKYAEALLGMPDTLNQRRALEVLGRIERAEGKGEGLTSRKISALAALHDTVAIVRELSDYTSAIPSSSYSSTFVGQIYGALGMADSAFVYFSKACEQDSANGVAAYSLAEYYLDRGDTLAFNRQVTGALLQDGLEPEVKHEILKDFVNQLGRDSLRYSVIDSVIGSTLDKYPLDPVFREISAGYLYHKGDFAASAEQFERSLDLDPSNPNLWNSVIYIYNNLDSISRSVEVAKRAFHFHPDVANFPFMAAIGMLNEGEPDSAMTYFRSALEVVTPKEYALRSALLSGIGDSFYKKEMPDSAFAYYSLALEEDPANYSAMNNFAYHLAVTGVDLDRAEELSSMCVMNSPDNDTAIDTYAWVLFKKGKYPEAKEQIDRALELSGEKPEAEILEHAGDIYYKSKLTAEAVDFWKRALELDPGNELLRKKVKDRKYYNPAE